MWRIEENITEMDATRTDTLDKLRLGGGEVSVRVRVGVRVRVRVRARARARARIVVRVGRVRICGKIEEKQRDTQRVTTCM